MEFQIRKKNHKSFRWTKVAVRFEGNSGGLYRNIRKNSWVLRENVGFCRQKKPFQRSEHLKYLEDPYEFFKKTFQLGHSAQREVPHGYWGPGHSGATVRMWLPSWAALATTSPRGLKGGLAHSEPGRVVPGCYSKYLECSGNFIPGYYRYYDLDISSVLETVNP